MSTFRLGAVCVGVVAMTALNTLAPLSQAAVPTARNKVTNVAHRGASGLAPEHTIPAYDLALRQGADYIEQDLQMTRDGVLVVLHDPTLDRTARGPAEDCTGPIAGKTLEQVKNCDFGSWFNETYPGRARNSYRGLEIPTLEEVFLRYGTTVNYYIEVKNPETNPGIEEELLRLMEDHGLIQPARESWRILIQSFVPTSLQKIHALDPDLPLIQLYPRGGSGFVRSSLEATADYAVGVGPSFEDATADVIEAAHALCLEVHPYTVNSRRNMTRLINDGVDGMFTNFPRRLEDAAGTGAIRDPLRALQRSASETEECRAG